MTSDPRDSANDPSGQGETATSSASPAPLQAPSAPSFDEVVRERVREARKRVGRRRPVRKAGSPNKKGGKQGSHIAPGENPNGIGGKEKGVKQPHISPKVKNTRNELMLAAHLGGRTIKEISEVFGVSHLTASEGITDATRTESFTAARNYIQFRLLPKALRVVDAALDEGNVDVARWVAEGVSVVGSRALAFDGKDQRATGAAGGGDDFETYRLELIRRRRSPLPAGSPGGASTRVAEPSGTVIDVEVAEAVDE